MKTRKMNEDLKKELQHQKDFARYQFNWTTYIRKNINKGNKTFIHFAIDDTQIPCLLIMNFISLIREGLPEEDYESFKEFVHNALEGNIPKSKPFLRVVK